MFWSTLLLTAGVVWTVAIRDLDLVPMLLLLAGGWCAGFSFVNLTMRMPRGGVFLHVAVAVVGGAILAFATEYSGRLVEPLPEALAGALIALQLAAIPAVGWIWLGLIARVTDAVTRGRRARP